jgi:hypothetical protein
VTARAFAVLRQLPEPLRVALLAAGSEIASVNEAGGLVAEPAPGRFTAGVNLPIGAIGRYVAVLAAVETSHSNSGFRIFALYYSYRQNRHLSI